MHNPSSSSALAEGARDLAQAARSLAASWGHGFALEQEAAHAVSRCANVLSGVAHELDHVAADLHR